MFFLCSFIFLVTLLLFQIMYSVQWNASRYSWTYMWVICWHFIRKLLVGYHVKLPRTTACSIHWCPSFLKIWYHTSFPCMWKDLHSFTDFGIQWLVTFFCTTCKSPKHFFIYLKQYLTDFNLVDSDLCTILLHKIWGVNCYRITMFSY